MPPHELPKDPASLVEEILRWAATERATDVHFAPMAAACLVRARVDGLLRDLHTLDLNTFPRVVSRIKVLADLDISERRRPQDGRISFVFEDRPVDFRVSIIPTLHGESVVLRVLDRAAGLRDLDQLGLTPREARDFRSLLSDPSGMIIVTGPTGAGKTTTLYAALLVAAVQIGRAHV